MSKYPRTDAARLKDVCRHMAMAEECTRMEYELNEAKARIKRLEEDLMDAKNQYAALVADVVLYEDRAERIKRLDETLEAVTDKIDNAWGIYMKFKEAKP